MHLLTYSVNRGLSTRLTCVTGDVKMKKGRGEVQTGGVEGAGPSRQEFQHALMASVRRRTNCCSVLAAFAISVWSQPRLGQASSGQPATASGASTKLVLGSSQAVCVQPTHSCESQSRSPTHSTRHLLLLHLSLTQQSGRWTYQKVSALPTSSQRPIVRGHRAEE